MDQNTQSSLLFNKQLLNLAAPITNCFTLLSYSPAAGILTISLAMTRNLHCFFISLFPDRINFCGPDTHHAELPQLQKSQVPPATHGAKKSGSCNGLRVSFCALVSLKNNEPLLL